MQSTPTHALFPLGSHLSPPPPLGLPIYHSKPGSKNVIWLNFEGHKTPEYNAWGAFDALGYDPSYNGPDFDDAERIAVGLIWGRVAEDYSPFDIDITTEAPPGKVTAGNARLLHCAIVSATTRDRKQMPFSSGGGVAYLDIFLVPSDYLRPALVFWDRLGGGSTDYVAEAVSHEVSCQTWNRGCADGGPRTQGSYLSSPFLCHQPDLLHPSSTLHTTDWPQFRPLA